VQVFTSITSTDEKFRLQLEPRTSTYSDRFKILQVLSSNSIPVGVMNAPIIPGLNDNHMHDVLKRASDCGARWAGYTLVRLNGDNEAIFSDWLGKTFTDRADKVMNLIADTHGGQVNDSREKLRMKGEGNFAAIIEQQFKLYEKKYGFNKTKLVLNTSDFRRAMPGQLELF
jgi:DNA repair photolyase